MEAQLQRERLERVTMDISKAIEEDMVTKIIQEVSSSVYDTDVTQRLKQMADAEKAVQLSRCKKFWTIWKKKFTVNTRIKRAMEDFPGAPSLLSSSKQLQNLFTADNEQLEDRRFYVNKKARLTTETPAEIEQRRKETEIYITARKLYNDLRNHTAWQPLDLPKVVGQSLAEKQPVARGNFSRTHRIWFN